jgi:hypothetical protein
MTSQRVSFFFGAISRYSLYLLWRTPPQQDAAAIGAKEDVLIFIITNKLKQVQ